MTRSRAMYRTIARLGPRRGAAAFALSLALMILLVAALTSFLMLVAARAGQSAYERNSQQALYAAEAGVEASLATLAAGRPVPDPLKGQCGQATWQATVEPSGDKVRIDSVGVFRGKIGRPAYRQVRVRARRADGGFHILHWQRVPCAPPDDLQPELAPSPPSRRG